MINWDEYETYVIKTKNSIYLVNLSGCWKVQKIEEDISNFFDPSDFKLQKNIQTTNSVNNNIFFVGSIYIVSRMILDKKLFKNMKNKKIAFPLSSKKIAICKFDEQNIVTALNRIIDSQTIMKPLSQNLLRKVLFGVSEPIKIKPIYCSRETVDLIKKIKRLKDDMFYLIDLENKKIVGNKFLYHFSLELKKSELSNRNNRKKIEYNKFVRYFLKNYVGETNLFVNVFERNNIIKVHDVAAILPNPKDNKSPIFVGAVDESKTLAFIRTIMEGLERYSAIAYGIKEKYYKELINVAQLSLNTSKILSKILSELDLFLPSQREKNNFPFCKVSRETLLTKCNMIDISSNKEVTVFLPASRVFLYFNDTKNCQVFPSFSHGLAASFSLEVSLTNAIKEIIERDAAMLSWIFRINPTYLEIRSIFKFVPSIKNLIIHLNDKGIDVLFYFINSDFEVPVIMCILFSKHDYPWLSVGLSCGLDLKKTIKKSFYEALMVRKTLIDLKITGNLKIPKMKKEIKRLLDHVTFYSSYSSTKRKYIKFIIDTPKSTDVSKILKQHKNKKESLSTYLKVLRKNGINYLIYKSLPVNETRQLGIVSCRVIIPKVAILHRDENFPFLGTKRVIEYANKLGININRLKIYPHFFG